MLQVEIYPWVSHSYEWKVAGGRPLASQIMADSSSNYRVLGPHFNFGERIWTHLLLSASFSNRIKNKFFIFRDFTGQIGDEQGTQSSLGCWLYRPGFWNFPLRCIPYWAFFTGDGKGELCHLKFRTLKYHQVQRQLLVVWNNNNICLQKPSLLFYLCLNYITSKNTVWREGHSSVHILSPPLCIWVYKIHLRVRNQMVIMASEGTSHMPCSVVSHNTVSSSPQLPSTLY